MFRKAFQAKPRGISEFLHILRSIGPEIEEVSRSRAKEIKDGFGEVVWEVNTAAKKYRAVSGYVEEGDPNQYFKEKPAKRPRRR